MPRTSSTQRIPVGATGTFTHIQAKTNSSGGTAALTVTLDNPTTLNSLVTINVKYASLTNYVTSVVDNVGNVYVRASSVKTASNTVSQFFGIQKIAGATTVTINATASLAFRAIVSEFGLNIVTNNDLVIDKAATNAASSTSGTTTIAPAASGELVVATYMPDSAAGTYVAGTSYTLSDSTTNGAVVYRLSGTTSETAPASWTNNIAWGSVAVAYKPTTPARTTAGQRTIIPNITSCLSFNASSPQRGTFGTSFAYTDKITLMGYFMIRDNTNFSNFPTFWSVGGNGGAFLIVNSSGTIGMHVKITSEKSTNTTGIISNTGKFKYNQWYFIAGTYDSTSGSNNLNIYIFDLLGNLIETNTSTQTGTITYTSSTASLAWDPPRGFYMNINASEVLILNDALSQSAIQSFIRNRTLTTTTGGYWKLNDGSGTSAAPTLSNVTGALLNTPTWSTSPPIPNRTIAS